MAGGGSHPSRGCFARSLLALIALLAAVAVPILRSRWCNYWIDFVLHAAERGAGNGAAYHLRQAAPTAADGDVVHAGRAVYLTFAEVSARLRAYPAQAATGIVRHPNMLAEVELSPALWEGLSAIDGVALASTPEQRKVWRPYLNKHVGREANPSRYTPGALRESAEAFLDATATQISLPTAPCAWLATVHWRVMLDLDLSREEAFGFCEAYQPALLRNALLPDWTKRLPLDVFGFAALRSQQAHMLERIRSSPTVHAAAAGNASKAALIAHAAHDASALSRAAPSLISKALWLLHNSSDVPLTPPLFMGDPQLSDPKVLRAFVLEVARLFPEVTHVPLDRADGRRELLSIEAAMRDAAVWGANADSFDLSRSTDIRTGPYGVLWAHPANGARGCPGMSLSLHVMEAFLGAYLAQAQRWGLRNGEELSCAAFSCAGTLVRIEGGSARKPTCAACASGQAA